MSKKNNRARERKELKDEYLPSGYKKSLRVEDLDLGAAAERVKKYKENVVVPREEEKVEKTLEDFDSVVKTQKELLDLFNPEKLKISVIYNRVRIDFKLKPVSPDDDLGELQLDLNVYNDLSELEKNVVKKSETEGNDTLTSTERRLYDNTQEKLANKVAGRVLEQVHNVLATYVSPVEGEFMETKEERLNFWKNVPFKLKTFLAAETMERLGFSPNLDAKLFRTD
jgi:hypothetical protein